MSTFEDLTLSLGLFIGFLALFNAKPPLAMKANDASKGKGDPTKPGIEAAMPIYLIGNKDSWGMGGARGGVVPCMGMSFIIASVGRFGDQFVHQQGQFGDRFNHEQGQFLDRFEHQQGQLGDPLRCFRKGVPK